MKIITWNCQGAFRNKADAIFVHKPDILVIQECEYVDKLVLTNNSLNPTTCCGLETMFIKDCVFFHTTDIH